MIFVLGGTKESRELIKTLTAEDKAVAASVTTDYGADLLENLNVEVIKEQLTKETLSRKLTELNVEWVVDATHPFAVEISQTALQVSKELEVNYLRFEREKIQYPDDESIIKVDSYQQAAKKAAQFTKIFLTIGSNKLDCFLQEVDNWQERLVVRLLPNWQFIQRVQDLGFTPDNLVALQGPFSRELNQALFKEYEVEAVVTKATGQQGGLETKVAAACELGLKVILINRPQLDYKRVVSDYQEAIEIID
jgi:precorrin-6A/cobalt-precorrin-6A reductase